MSINLENCINGFTISIALFVILAIVCICVKLTSKGDPFTPEQRTAQGKGYKLGLWVTVSYFIINSLYCLTYGNWGDTLCMNTIGVCVGILTTTSYMVFTNSFVSFKEKPINKAFFMIALLMIGAAGYFTDINTNNTLDSEGIACIIGDITIAILCAELIVKSLIDSAKKKA